MVESWKDVATHFTTHEVGEWLAGLGYPEYQHTFEVNNIDGARLEKLDSSRLSKLGVHDLKHITTICAAIRKAFGSESPNWKKTIADIPFTYHANQAQI